MGHQNNITEM